MNLQFLGDALDHWKGSVFERLQKAGQLRRFAVDAMASDADCWKPDDWTLFSSLLRVEPTQIVKHDVSLSKNREGYFKELPKEGDLFLDPDTGIQTGRVRIATQYLTPTELSDVLKSDTKRLVMVYQHVRARPTRERVEQVFAALLDVHVSSMSYESGTVAMLFFSLTSSRIESVADYFRKFLGFHADRRIYCSPEVKS